MKKKYVIFIISLFGVLCSTTARNPKREFRGAWIQAVNGQFMGMGRDAMQAELTRQLDVLQADGINAILFQVRVEGDALYESSLEPWSRYLTGQQGTPPNPYWDPLAWMVEACHHRGMELHAWINPYRGKTKGTQMVTATHQLVLHPERFFPYNDLYIFDPGLPENSDYICSIAADIVKRYDIDGFHIDDYFYPYPANGAPIPDARTYACYGKGMRLADWRRENVNHFIEALHNTIRSIKPWVKFGVSPFGIYRNQSSWDLGSRTHGLQNYDDLYADVLLWVEKGWIDYNIPQIYWEIGNKAADYDELIHWWSDHAGQRPLYIGQDVERTVKYPDANNPMHHQLEAKMQLQRTLPGIEGSCQWYAKAVVNDPGNYGTVLRKRYHNTPALQPAMPWIDDKAPDKAKKLAMVWTADGPFLFWTPPTAKKEMDKPVAFVVYRFPKGATIDLNNAENIVTITKDNYCKLPYFKGKLKWTYVVTALDRLHNESKPAKKTIKL